MFLIHFIYFPFTINYNWKIDLLQENDSNDAYKTPEHLMITLLIQIEWKWVKYSILYEFPHRHKVRECAPDNLEKEHQKFQFSFELQYIPVICFHLHTFLKVSRKREIQPKHGKTTGFCTIIKMVGNNFCISCENKSHSNSPTAFSISSNALLSRWPNSQRKNPRPKA